MTINEIFCLLAIYKGYEVIHTGISSPSLDSAHLSLVDKHYIKPNGLGYDVTSKGKEIITQIVVNL